jgi:succinate-semialdehyde dehydrogenase / glutarate-semialdehyde dehydrogenase
MAMATTSAVTGEILTSFAELTPEELEDKLARAVAAAESYRLTSVEQRAGWLVKDVSRAAQGYHGVSGRRGWNNADVKQTAR